jgi:hypothetical protein
MKLRTGLFGLVLGVAFALTASSVRAAGGEDLKVTNKTGHLVDVYLLQNDSVDLDPDDGVQFAHLKDAESAVAHVPNCTFAIVLVDHEDVWHAEFHDCHSTEMTFTKDTGHSKREHHQHH